jgi:hypothetical protein
MLKFVRCSEIIAKSNKMKHFVVKTGNDCDIGGLQFIVFQFKYFVA